MIVDTSALMAILKKEPGFEILEDKLVNTTGAKISIASVVELLLVTRNEAKVDEILNRFDLEVIAVDYSHLYWLRHAIRNFARGSKHPAKLNYGDCFAYAASRATGEPLLFAGTDFAATDAIPAVTAQNVK